MPAELHTAHVELWEREILYLQQSLCEFAFNMQFSIRWEKHLIPAAAGASN